MNNYLRNAIKILGMSFMADPPIPAHQKYMGIIEYPGFHTTTSFNVAAIYAIGRIEQSYEHTDALGKHYVSDYPVVVALDMTSYEKHTDYDAENFVKESFDVQLGELVKEIEANTTEEEIVDKIQKYIDYSESQQEMQDNPLDYIFQDVFQYFQNPLFTLLDFPNAANIVREYAEKGTLPSDLLMAATEQYRYVTDIDENRITAIYYVTPVASDREIMETDWDDPKYEEIEEKWEGFDIPSIDDIYSGYFSPTHTLVYGAAQEGNEFHGTTYQRLISAAPFLTGLLPEPPSPPYVQE